MEWLRKLGRIIGDRNFILALGFVLGLALGEGPARVTQPFVLPSLALLIAVTASEISTHVFRRWRRVLQGTVLAIVATYVVSAGAYLIVARLLVPEPEVYTGYVLVAASPPAAGALGFCIALRGDVVLSLIGTVGTYLASLILGPLIALLFARPGLIQPAQLFIVLVQFVAIPLLVSRLLRYRAFLPYARKAREPIVTFAYLILLFTVVGLNRSVFFTQPGLVALIAVVPLACTFGVGTLAEWVLRRLRVERKTRVSVVLLATLKNSGFAAAVALALVSRQASLPGAVASIVNVLYIIWLGLRTPRQR